MNQWLTPCHPFFVFKDGHFHLSSSQRIISARPSTPRCSCCNRSWKVGIKSATGPFQRQVAIAVPSAKMALPARPWSRWRTGDSGCSWGPQGRRRRPPPPYPLLFSRALRPIRVVFGSFGQRPQKGQRPQSQGTGICDWGLTESWAVEEWSVSMSAFLIGITWNYRTASLWTTNSTVMTRQFNKQIQFFLTISFTLSCTVYTCIHCVIHPLLYNIYPFIRSVDICSFLHRLGSPVWSAENLRICQMYIGLQHGAWRMAHGAWCRTSLNRGHPDLSNTGRFGWLPQRPKIAQTHCYRMHLWTLATCWFFSAIHKTVAPVAPWLNSCKPSGWQWMWKSWFHSIPKQVMSGSWVCHKIMRWTYGSPGTFPLVSIISKSPVGAKMLQTCCLPSDWFQFQHLSTDSVFLHTYVLQRTTNSHVTALVFLLDSAHGSDTSRSFKDLSLILVLVLNIGHSLRLSPSKIEWEHLHFKPNTALQELYACWKNCECELHTTWKVNVASWAYEWYLVSSCFQQFWCDHGMTKYGCESNLW